MPPLHLNTDFVHWTQVLMTLRQALSVAPHPVLCMIFTDDDIMASSVQGVSSTALRWIQVTPEVSGTFCSPDYHTCLPLRYLWQEKLILRTGSSNTLHYFWPSQLVPSMLATHWSASAPLPSPWSLLLGSRLTFSSCSPSFFSSADYSRIFPSPVSFLMDLPSPDEFPTFSLSRW